MPYKSSRQRRYLKSQKPEVAKKFDAHEKQKATVKALRGGGFKSNQSRSPTGSVG